MYFEILAIGIIAFVVLTVNGYIKPNKFIQDNQDIFQKLKEEDYDFLVRAKYGDGLDADVLYQKRIKNGLIVSVLLIFIMLSDLSAVKILLSLVGGYLAFKVDYSNLKKYYKRHLVLIDSMLPYYLKGLEILIQHYTVPVALGKSIADAPEIFRDGLIEMINKINAGDSTVTPYMEFAQMYPVRDSMRMMRLLYRLSLGRQERKQEQLITFSKTISNLQQKARETRYKERLDKMESKTMSMLVCTGVGVMILLVIQIIGMIGG
ncbi:MAG TPA: hypothetical protein IAC02_09820 [Candidatus Coprovivens excrementavium]|nr:hypothetical protein [Candidatus Coprovivens excrementavium]